MYEHVKKYPRKYPKWSIIYVCHASKRYCAMKEDTVLPSVWACLFSEVYRVRLLCGLNYNVELRAYH